VGRDRLEVIRRLKRIIDLNKYERMYAREGRYRYEIAREMGMNVETLKRCVENDPVLRDLRLGCRNFPQLNLLNIGESMLAPRNEKKNYNFARFYLLASRLGIRVSVRSVSETELRITRIA
jgi:hypothetical protein